MLQLERWCLLSFSRQLSALCMGCLKNVPLKIHPPMRTALNASGVLKLLRGHRSFCKAQVFHCTVLDIGMESEFTVKFQISIRHCNPKMICTNPARQALLFVLIVKGNWSTLNVSCLFGALVLLEEILPKFLLRPWACLNLSHRNAPGVPWLPLATKTKSKLTVPLA